MTLHKTKGYVEQELLRDDELFRREHENTLCFQPILLNMQQILNSVYHVEEFLWCHINSVRWD